MWIFFVCLFFVPLHGGEITETRLDNGMRVILMPNESGEDEILFQLIAKGGFASLPPDQQVAGRVAPLVIWEVGLDGMTAEEVSTKLYKAGSDITLTAYPLYRKIEGSTDKAGLKSTFEVVSLIYTEPKLSPSQLRTGIESLKIGYKAEKRDPTLSLEVETKLLNSQNWPPFLPLKKSKIENIDLQALKSFYINAFESPEDFLLVLVGTFEPLDAIKTLKETLSVIPKSKGSTLFAPPPPFPPFAPGISTKELVQKERRDATVRLTFPIKTAVNEKNIEELEYITQLVETRLHKLTTTRKGASKGVDVSYEFPYYPYLDQPWLMIQLYSTPSEADEFYKRTLAELKLLLEKGPTESEIETALRQVSYSDNFWQKQNDYWISKISNIYLWGWDPKLLQKSPKLPMLSPNEAKQSLNRFLSLDNYSRITSSP